MKIQSLLALCLAGIGLGLGEVPGEAIQHDAEYYVVQKQYADAWATEDKQLDAKIKDEWDKDYALDRNFRPYDYVMAIEAKKRDKVAQEWGRPSIETSNQLHDHLEVKSLECMRKNVKAKKPF